MTVDLNLSDYSVKFRIELAYLTEDRNVLTVLAEDESWEVQLAVAENNNTPEDSLDKLSHLENTRIVIAVAENESTGITTLCRLAKSHLVPVRRAVASNPKSNEEILKVLARDSDREVQEEVVYNPSSSESVLFEVLEEDVPYWILQVIPENPNATSKIFGSMFEKCRDSDVMVAILENQKTPSTLLDGILSKYPDLKAVALDNPNVSMKTILQLMTDEDCEVRRAARKARNRKKAEEAKKLNKN